MSANKDTREEQSAVQERKCYCKVVNVCKTVKFCKRQETKDNT